MSVPKVTSLKRLGNEVLEECPYDSNHRVRLAKLDEHVANCRKNYDDYSMKTKGYRQIVLNCMYNGRHEVPEVEWSFHIGRCPDREKLWTYQLRTSSLKDVYPNLFSITGGDFPRKKEELVDLYDGLKPGVLITDSGRNIKLAHIGKEPAQIALHDAAEKGKILAEEVEEAWLPGNEETKEMNKEPTYQIHYTQEEIDYWNAPGMGGKPFSWWLHNSRPRGYVANYPPGLNKRERREFEKRNSELYEKKLAAEAKAREEAAQAAREQDGGAEGGTEAVETEGGAEVVETGEDGNFAEIEEEDDDGWVSQFTPGFTARKMFRDD